MFPVKHAQTRHTTVEQLSREDFETWGTQDGMKSLRWRSKDLSEACRRSNPINLASVEGALETLGTQTRMQPAPDRRRIFVQQYMLDNNLRHTTWHPAPERTGGGKEQGQGPRRAEITTQQSHTPINTPSRSQQATAAGPRSSAQHSPLVTSPPEDLPQHQGRLQHQQWPQKICYL